MIKENDSFFEKPFIKEYLFNLQANEKVSMKEFIFTKKVIILFLVYLFLMWYNQDGNGYQKWISVFFALIFLYMFKNNRLLKREKYEVPHENIKNKHSQFIFHGIYSRTVKKVLSQKHYSIVFFLLIPVVGYSDFVSNINTSIQTQNEKNQIHKDENIIMGESSKIKHIMYLSQENKYFATKELDSAIKTETDLILNKIRINLEKSKNEIKK